MPMRQPIAAKTSTVRVISSPSTSAEPKSKGKTRHVMTMKTRDAPEASRSVRARIHRRSTATFTTFPMIPTVSAALSAGTTSTALSLRKGTACQPGATLTRYSRTELTTAAMV